MSSGRFSRYKRKVDTREEIKSVLIVCGGEETEPNYFNSFKTYTSNVIHIQESNLCTVPLVNEAIRYKNEGNYDTVWCVFDKDNFCDFDQAINLAGKNKIKVAYSNMCFELWLLMHFNTAPNGTPSQLESALNKQFRKNYKKGYNKKDTDIYQLLKDNQSIAIAKAKANYNDRMIYGNSPASQSPVTTVFKLVEELNDISNNRWT